MLINLIRTNLTSRVVVPRRWAFSHRIFEEKPKKIDARFPWVYSSSVALTQAKVPEEPVKPTSPTITWYPDVDEPLSVAATKVTGAVLPFSYLNFMQIALFPVTYAVMYYMDFLVNYSPWWMAIIMTTATFKFALFPMVVKQNIIGIKTFNVLPETQKIQIKMNEAMMEGDEYNKALCKTKLQLLYREHGISLKDRLLPVLFQAPIFMSVFFALRGLSTIPAEGLATGGAFWFTDLTQPDPLFLLPAMTCASLFLMFEYGMEGGLNSSKSMGPIGRYLIRAMPFGIFALTYNFPAAILLFWCTNNFLSLNYALLLKNRWIKQKLNIPARIEHDAKDLPLSQMSLRGQIKSAVDKSKVQRSTMEVRRLDDIAFRKAGVGPLRKTYKEPPKGD